MTIFECDGCGKQARCPSGFKPPAWFARNPVGKDVTIHACSRECIETAEAKRKAAGLESTTVVLPL